MSSFDNVQKTRIKLREITSNVSAKQFYSNLRDAAHTVHTNLAPISSFYNTLVCLNAAPIHIKCIK